MESSNKGNPRPTKAYPCSYCGKVFRGASARIVHVRRHHTGEKPFACSYKGCGKRFYCSSSLGVHMKIHLEKRPGFPCTHCGKVLLTKVGLDYHIKSIHTLERPFKCPIASCNMSFMTKANLQNHLKRHNKHTEREKKLAEKQLEQCMKKNDLLKEKLTAETRRAHELEVKLRKLVRKFEKGPKLAGRLKAIKEPLDNLPDWVPQGATAFYIPEEPHVALSNVRVIIRDKHGVRLTGMDEYRELSTNKNHLKPSYMENQLDLHSTGIVDRSTVAAVAALSSIGDEGGDHDGHGNVEDPKQDHSVAYTSQGHHDYHMSAVQQQSKHYGGLPLQQAQSQHYFQNNQLQPQQQQQQQDPQEIHMSSAYQLQHQAAVALPSSVSRGAQDSRSQARPKSSNKNSLAKQRLLRKVYEEKSELWDSGISFQSWVRGLSPAFKQQIFEQLPQSASSSGIVAEDPHRSNDDHQQRSGDGAQEITLGNLISSIPV